MYEKLFKTIYHYDNKSDFKSSYKLDYKSEINQEIKKVRLFIEKWIIFIIYKTVVRETYKNLRK